MAIHICTISNEDTELETYIAGLHALGIKMAPTLNIKVGNIFYNNLNYKKAES